MKVLKGLFYTFISAFVTLLLLAFCCSLVNRRNYSDDASYLRSDYEEELDKELKPVYNTEIERELIEEVKRLKRLSYPSAIKEEAEARRKLRRYRWDKDIEKRIKESEEWRKREGRLY